MLLLPSSLRSTADLTLVLSTVYQSPSDSCCSDVLQWFIFASVAGFLACPGSLGGPPTSTQERRAVTVCPLGGLCPQGVGQAPESQGCFGMHLHQICLAVAN